MVGLLLAAQRVCAPWSVGHEAVVTAFIAAIVPAVVTAIVAAIITAVKVHAGETWLLETVKPLGVAEL